MTQLSTPSAATPARPRPGRLRSLLRLSRPQQWHKSAMLYAAPTAAGIVDQPASLLRATVAAIAFTALAVAVYAFNDIRDAPDDRRHPRKRTRPVAAGNLSPRTARAWGCTTAVAGLAVAAPLGLSTFAVALTYLVTSLLYVNWLKRVAVVDVVTVALGFVLRAAAGGTATGVQLSSWFLAVALFGALFLVAGKRRAEAPAGTPNRPAYPSAWLDQLITVSLLGASLSYGSWAFQYLGHESSKAPLALSFLPFLTGLLRYGLLVSTDRGEIPEHDVFRDPVLIVAGLGWAGLLAAGLYLA